MTEEGERNAVALGRRLGQLSFDRVLVSPLIRARRTAELAGYAKRAEVDDRVMEMNFGEYEGMLREDVVKTRPGWKYLRDGCPGGETVELVGQRADSVIAELCREKKAILIFSHSVFLRVMWYDQTKKAGWG